MSLHDDPGLDLNTIARFGARIEGDGEPQLVQAVVAPGSEFIGRSIRELDFARQFHVVIAGLWRRSGEASPRLSDARLREGDLLVLWGRPSRFAELAAHHGFLMLVPFAGEAKRRLRAPVALVILAITILAAATEWLSAPLAFLLGAVAMVATRCLDVEQAYRDIDVRIYVMIAGVIPLGIAMEQTGTADLLANALLHVVIGWSPLAVLLVMFGIAALLTQIMSDAATTVLLGPIAVALAQSLGQPVTPFVVVTALGAVVAFLTPIGHHGNLLILGPGQYRFGDFLRIGLPLTVLIALTSAWMARWLWLGGPLWPVAWLATAITPAVAAAGLEQLALRRRLARRDEPGGVQRRQAAVADALVRLREPLREQLRERAFAAHARAERAVVILAAAHLPHQAHDVRGALGIVQLQPFAPDRLQLMRQPQQHVAGRACAVRMRGFQDVLEFHVGDHRHHRRHHHPARHAGIGQRAQRAQLAVRCGRPRLHPRGQVVVERGDREVHADQLLARHRREQVEVALDQRRPW